jgi:hypothetical protein
MVGKIRSREGLIRSISKSYKSWRHFFISSVVKSLLKRRTLVTSYMIRSGAIRMVLPDICSFLRRRAQEESSSSINHLVTTEASTANISYEPRAYDVLS